MYYTGINPLDMKPVYVATDYHEKQLQRALLQYNRPQNADLVREALQKAGREDLIGYGEECLVRPAGAKGQYLGKPAQKSVDRPKNQSKTAKQSNSGAKRTSGKPQADKGAKSGATSTQKSLKPAYKAGWAKPKAKKGGKKK
jgi:hypothetical protein